LRNSWPGQLLRNFSRLLAPVRVSQLSW
jgi:hypothetical protein